jgi:GNAT superfamily N-acetyltransferase
VARLLVTSVDGLSDQQLARVRMIYEEAFAADLRVPFGELSEQGDGDLMLVALDGAMPVGFGALRLLGSVDWTFLRYFAIDRERQGQGLGREFWRLLLVALAQEAWPERTVFEVEDPGEPGTDQAERAIRKRRIRFWTACAARLLPAPGYVLPDYTGSGMTEPMLLMAATPAADDDRLIDGDRLKSLVLAIYTDRYGMAPDDPLVSRALASIIA